MLSCKHCSTPNSLDSTFCRKCGTALPEQELQESQAKLEALVKDGDALFNQGRIEEAIAIAEASVQANPSSVAALALLALCHERRGEIASALECAERLVELNPDSEFDKITRNRLRSKLESDLRVPPAPDRKLALVGSVAAVVLVLCVGAIVARSGAKAASANMATNSSQPQIERGAVETPTTSAQVTPPANPRPNNVAQVTNEQPGTTNDPSRLAPDDVRPLGQSNRPTPRPERSISGGGFRDVPLPNAPSGQLPVVVEQGATEISPVFPNVPGEIKNNPTPAGPPARPKRSGNPLDEEPGIDPRASLSAERSEEKAPDPGMIQIDVKRGSRSSGGGEAVNGNGLESLLRVGSQQYQLGNYSAAARSYEQALRAGGDGVILNRRLGMAYDRLGRTGEAADSYRRAISAIDAAIASGRGNKETLGNTRDLCEQALRTLGGG